VSQPLLIVSDLPTAATGLGRIAGELAERIAGNMANVFRVAVCGVGGTSSRHLRYMTYPVNVAPDMSIPALPAVWNDFAGDEEGVLLAIYNSSWCEWMVDPARLPQGDLRAFLQGNPFKRWGYFPIDGEGPLGGLPRSQGRVFEGFDRLLAPTRFGAEVIRRTSGIECPVIPHGVDTTVFYPRDREEARDCFLGKVANYPKGKLKQDFFLIGVVATNSPRKDWGLAFQVCHKLISRGENVGLWAHVDAVTKPGAWDLRMLAEEFGMDKRTIFTNGKLDNDAMAWGYSAMDVTMGVGSGEGMGLPIFESMACGVPCVHGAYSGAEEFLPGECKVTPRGFRLDGYYGIKRPVYDASDWADAVMSNRGAKAELPPGLSWGVVWPSFERWLRDGVK
jgi:glycosyltransferase involved in cell wall biosynthesis